MSGGREERVQLWTSSEFVAISVTVESGFDILAVAGQPCIVASSLGTGGLFAVYGWVSVGLGSCSCLSRRVLCW